MPASVGGQLRVVGTLHTFWVLLISSPPSSTLWHASALLQIFWSPDLSHVIGTEYRKRAVVQDWGSEVENSRQAHSMNPEKNGFIVDTI